MLKVIGKARQRDSARHEVNETQLLLSVSSRVSSCTDKNTFGSNRCSKMLRGSHENAIKTVQLLWLPRSKRVAHPRTGANLFDDRMRKKRTVGLGVFQINAVKLNDLIQ